MKRSLRLLAAAVESSPRIPAGLSVDYAQGSRRFLIKPLEQSVSGDLVVIECFVNNRMHLSKKLLKKKPSAPGEDGILIPRARRRFLPPTLSPDECPVQFSAFVSRARGTALCLEALCSVVHGLLCVDGALFHASIDDAASDDVLGPKWSQYHGPLLNQKHLAECLCSVRGQPNPVIPYRQEQQYFFDPFVNPVSSKFARFDHAPVHTVPNELTNKLVDFLADRGVDDDLAAFVERYANFVEDEERRLWRESLADAGVFRVSRCP